MRYAAATVPAKCPLCERALRRIPLEAEDTLVVRRTCRCGSRWQVIARPNPIKGGIVTVLDFTPIPEEPR